MKSFFIKFKFFYSKSFKKILTKLVKLDKVSTQENWEIAKKEKKEKQEEEWKKYVYMYDVGRDFLQSVLNILSVMYDARITSVYNYVYMLV